MSSQRDKRLERAQLKVLFTVPFFAPGVARLPVVWDDAVPTACTNGKEIRWNGAWFDKLPDPVLPTVLCHEVAHCLLGHLWRAPAGVDWDLWNQATDHAVNLMLTEFGQGVQAKRLADPFPFPEPKDAYCADPKFSGMAEEAIYSALGKRPKDPSGGGGGKPGSGKGKGAGKPAPGSMPEFGQMSQPKADPAAQSAGKNLASDWDGTLINSAKMAAGRGELPGSLSRFVDALVSPQVPWYQVLRNWLREQCADDWNWTEPALEYSDCGFILPSLKSDRIGSVVFATDTSGSIDKDLLAQFQSEKQQCLDEMRPRSLLDICCDTRIHKIAEYGVGDTISRDAPGGGGTDFCPVFEHLQTVHPAPKCLVYLTDLDGSFPGADPGFPVLWVTWTKGGQAPFGEVVYAGAS